MSLYALIAASAGLPPGLWYDGTGVLGISATEVRMAGSRKIMSAEERNRRKSEVPQWTVGEDKLTRSYTFPDFQKGLDFVNRIGAVAEEQGHHPDIQLSWGKVVV